MLRVFFILIKFIFLEKKKNNYLVGFFNFSKNKIIIILFK